MNERVRRFLARFAFGGEANPYAMAVSTRLGRGISVSSGSSRSRPGSMAGAGRGRRRRSSRRRRLLARPSVGTRHAPAAHSGRHRAGKRGRRGCTARTRAPNVGSLAGGNRPACRRDGGRSRLWTVSALLCLFWLRRPRMRTRLDCPSINPCGFLNAYHVRDVLSYSDHLVPADGAGSFQDAYLGGPCCAGRAPQASPLLLC
jgi:hypothetical protein